MGLLVFYLLMFDRLTKRIAGKTTDAAVENVKKTFNDRIDQYGDIIQIGLVAAVIILGGRHLTRRDSRRRDRYIPAPEESYLPAGMTYPYSTPPIVVNNYYREREESRYYEQRHKREFFSENGTKQPRRPAQETYPKRENRR